MSNIRNCEIIGYGTYLSDIVIQFGDQTRYRAGPETTQLKMMLDASQQALDRAEIEPDSIDCIISASAVGSQPIPCTASLLHELVAPDAPAASFDVNSTCTSFMTALDMASYLIDAGRYRNVLIASGDVGSRALNPEQRESFELFSDAAAAVVLSHTDRPLAGVVASTQRTWPRYAHNTEIRGGLSAIPPDQYESRPEDYMFDMDGRTALRGIMRVLPGFFKDFYASSGLTLDDFELVIPHQASRALELAMRLVEIPKGKYVDEVQNLGNMVSASVPYLLCKKLETGELKPGDRTLLCGTAAGLTANIVALEL